MFYKKKKDVFTSGNTLYELEKKNNEKNSLYSQEKRRVEKQTRQSMAPKEYKKSYGGFILWIVVYIILINLVSILVPILVPFLRKDQWIKILYLVILLGIDFLTWIVWKTENIYWYNGISFKEAKEAGSDRRKEYARVIKNKFLRVTILFCIYTLAGLFIGTSMILDFIVAFLLIIGCAVMTIRVKL